MPTLPDSTKEQKTHLHVDWVKKLSTSGSWVGWNGDLGGLDQVLIGLVGGGAGSWVGLLRTGPWVSELVGARWVLDLGKILTRLTVTKTNLAWMWSKIGLRWTIREGGGLLYIVFRRVMESGESHPHIRHVLWWAVVISLATHLRGPRFDSKAKWRQTGNLLYSMPPAHPPVNEYWVSVMVMSCLTIGFGCDVSFQMFPKINNFSSSHWWRQLGVGCTKTHTQLGSETSLIGSVLLANPGIHSPCFHGCLRSTSQQYLFPEL